MTVAYGLCHCGCGEKTNIARQDSEEYGHTKGEPYRFVNGHGRRKSPILYVVDQESDCWVWQGGLSNGYGIQWDAAARTTVKAHRRMYELHVGPIPKGLQIDHLCRNRACVNPAHLEPVTNRENTVRGKRCKLSTADVLAIRAADQNESHAAVARRYGVSPCHVSAIRRGMARAVLS